MTLIERLRGVAKYLHGRDMAPMVETVREAIDSLMREEKAEHFVCPECGPRVKADEDGCCATCGRDCRVEGR